MIVNLKNTTQKNQEQDWLKTNLAKFSSMMQGQKKLDAVARLIMSELTPLVSAHHGAFFMVDNEDSLPVLKLTSQGFGAGRSMCNPNRATDRLSRCICRSSTSPNPPRSRSCASRHRAPGC